MGDIENLKKKLAEIQNKRKEDQEIKKLRKQIKAEKFAQSKTGKALLPLARFGEKLTRPKAKGSPHSPSKKKRLSVEEVMRRLPQ